MKSHIHYEVAFDDFLRARGVPFVPVDEAKKSTFRDVRLKSFDFIVYSTGGTNWLVDIKGRRWGPRGKQSRPTLENWITQDDLDGLRQWQTVFGAGFRGLLVFAYLIAPPTQTDAAFAHRHDERTYVFAAVTLDEYAEHARVRSPRWGTINVPTARFRAFVRPMADFL